MDRVHDYEKVSIYHLDPPVQEELLSTQRECVFNWSTRDGWPMGVIMSCLWRDGRMWLTAGANRHRIAALRRRPQCSVVVTSTGTHLGPGKTVTIKGRAAIREDPETKAWFYPAFASHLYPEAGRAEAFCRMLDSPMRVVVEVEPVKFITYDGVKMFEHAAGRLSPEALREPLESDTVRFERELTRRGLD